MNQTMEEFCDAAQAARDTPVSAVLVQPTRIKVSDIAFGVLWGNVLTGIVCGVLYTLIVLARR